MTPADEAEADDRRHRRFVLAVDLGTSGLKVGLVSVTGRVAWQHHVEVTTARDDRGGVTQDADGWWRAMVDATRRGLATGGVAGDAVAAVNITGQWSSTVPTGADGRPVGNCVMWMDTCGGRYSREVIGGPVQGYDPRAAATWIRRSGGVPARAGNDPIGHMLHLDRDQPDVAAAARWYLEPVDHLSMRCTGVAAASHASMTGAWLTDNRRLDLLAYDPRLVALSGVDATKLPPLVPTGSVIGPVQPSAAAELGITTRAVVVTGAPDIHTAAVGAGAIGDHQAHLAISTTSWISCPLATKKTDVLRSIATIPGVTADRYLMANNQDTAGRCLEWVRVAVFGDSDAAPGYDEVLDLAATAAPGAGDVIFTPWLSGERSPVSDVDARGGFHNLSLTTTRADLVRAVLEGVAGNSRWLLGAAERFAGRRLDPIRLIGGGARSDLWCQILADVLDRTIERVDEPLHAGIRGAAIFAGMALGDVGPDEVRALVHVDTTFRPDPANRAVYDRMSAELPKLYKGQKATFARLNRGRRH